MLLKIAPSPTPTSPRDKSKWQESRLHRQLHTVRCHQLILVSTSWTQACPLLGLVGVGGTEKKPYPPRAPWSWELAGLAGQTNQTELYEMVFGPRTPGVQNLPSGVTRKR